MTVYEIQNSDLYDYNDAVQLIIDEARDAIAKSLGVVKVPVLYSGQIDGQKHKPFLAEALTPNLANLQVSDGRVLFPKQYLSKLFGNDIFESNVASQSKFPNASWVSDWDDYHILGGDIHCGMVAKRERFDFKWWEARK